MRGAYEPAFLTLVIADTVAFVLALKRHNSGLIAKPFPPALGWRGKLKQELGITLKVEDV